MLAETQRIVELDETAFRTDMNGGQKKGLIEIFDADGDGNVSLGEAVEVVGKYVGSTLSQIKEKAIKTLDEDGDGDLSLGEAVGGVGKYVGSTLSQIKDKAAQRITMLDEDGDGNVSLGEAAAALGNLMKGTQQSTNIETNLKNHGLMLTVCKSCSGSLHEIDNSSTSLPQLVPLDQVFSHMLPSSLKMLVSHLGISEDEVKGSYNSNLLLIDGETPEYQIAQQLHAKLIVNPRVSIPLQVSMMENLTNCCLICITFDPKQSKGKIRWDILVSILVFYSVIVIPIRAGFDTNAEGWVKWMEISMDIIFGLDIVIRFL